MKTSLPIVLLLLLFAGFSGDKPVVSDNEHMTMAVLYHQKAPEYRALCHQAYNLASVRIQQIVRKKGSADGLAVVLDLDETVLDNSPYEARCILDNITYPTLWKEWCEKGKAADVPGAVDFINLVHSLGVNIFYISNRKEEVRNATKRNMSALGLPDVRDENLLLRTADAAKEARRQQVAANYEIVMLIGDNLNDFSNVFEVSDPAVRKDKTEELKKLFSDKFIMLPNIMYGEWEPALYNPESKTTLQKRADRYKALRTSE